MTTTVHYVDKHGKIHKVVPMPANQPVKGRVDVRFSDGRVETVREMDLANTPVAANVMSTNRRSSNSVRNTVESPQILRNPK